MKLLLSRRGDDSVIFGGLLTKWKDAPCPPGAALLHCALLPGDPLASQAGRGTCPQVRCGLSALAGSFYL